MSKSVLYIGKSGSGKTTAIRTLNPETTFIIQTIAKELPWRGSEKQYTLCTAKTPNGNLGVTKKAKEIINWLHYVNDKLPHITDICIDDNTFVSSLELLDRNKETTWDKFSDIAVNFIDIVNTSKNLRSDLIVHILHHSITEGDGLLEEHTHRAQSYGKLIDEKLCSIEAQFTIVLRASKELIDDEIQYLFYTREANSTVKTPIGMFETVTIPNDLALVSKTIRNYYN